MSHEHPRPPIPSQKEGFGFTERERLYYRVTDERFRALLDDASTTIHRGEVSSNSYGSFLFLTISREREHQREYITFYGLGFHEFRERWYINEWFWHRSNPFPELLEKQLSHDEAETLIQERLDDVLPYVDGESQSGRGKLFELLADLTDEDGAIAELEDLAGLGDWLADAFE